MLFISKSGMLRTLNTVDENGMLLIGSKWEENALLWTMNQLEKSNLQREYYEASYQRQRIQTEGMVIFIRRK